MSTGLPCDQFGGSTSSSAASVAGASCASAPSSCDERVGRHHRRAAAVAHDGEPFACQGLACARAFRPHRTARASSSRAACRRDGTRRRRHRRRPPARRCARPLPCAPSACRPAFTTMTGLLRAARARGRHELARAGDGFDVEQDRARVRVVARDSRAGRRNRRRRSCPAR